MAYERTWQPMAVRGPYVVGTSPEAPARFLWELAQFLLGRTGTATLGLWTIVGSSDGSAAGLDGVDRWTSTYDLAKIPYSAAGTGAHGWMVLSRAFTVNSTSYTVRLLLSCRGVTAGETGRLVMVAGLGVPSGGSITADPTMSIQIGATWTTANNADYGTDFTNGRRLYGNMSTDGSFWFAETITGELAYCATLIQPFGTKANDICPFWAHLSNANATGQNYPYAGNALYLRNAAVNVGIYYNGATGYPALEQPPVYVLLDASDVSLFDRPAFVAVGSTITPAAVHARGRLPDMGLTSGLNTNNPALCRPCNIGSTIRDPGDNTIQYVTLNQVIVPYNALLS